MGRKTKTQLNLNPTIFNIRKYCFSQRVNVIEWDNADMPYDPIDMSNYHKSRQL